ncbi:MAG: penicillin-binding protein, partial [Chloroflexi bacterium CG_4_10_14_0_8_um_filter_57_5]
MHTPQSSVILDKQGNELFRFFEEDRRQLDFDEISPEMIQAIVATEDETFRSNPGIRLSSLIRATLHNIQVRQGDAEQLQGGSTITQQLIKNIYLTNEKTIQRKLQEIVLAVRLTRKWTDIYRKQG